MASPSPMAAPQPPRLLSRRLVQHACAACALPAAACAFAAFFAAGFLPPLPPSWAADRVVDHYRRHEPGLRAAAALLTLAALFYLPMVAAVAAQIRRVPRLHAAVAAAHLVAGAASAVFLVLAGVVLAVAAFRLDRPAHLTQALNDLFWLALVMCWPTFALQYLAVGLAIVADPRPRPLAPKPYALLNFMVAVFFVPTMAAHAVKVGPLAWDGLLGFWLPVVFWAAAWVVDIVCVLRAISFEARTGYELLSAGPGSSSENGAVHESASPCSCTSG